MTSQIESFNTTCVRNAMKMAILLNIKMLKWVVSFVSGTKNELRVEGG